MLKCSIRLSQSSKIFKKRIKNLADKSPYFHEPFCLLLYNLKGSLLLGQKIFLPQLYFLSIFGDDQQLLLEPYSDLYITYTEPGAYHAELLLHDTYLPRKTLFYSSVYCNAVRCNLRQALLRRELYFDYYHHEQGCEYDLIFLRRQFQTI